MLKLKWYKLTCANTKTNLNQSNIPFGGAVLLLLNNIQNLIELEGVWGFSTFVSVNSCFWRLSKVCSFYIVYNLKSRSTDLLTMESVYIYFTCFRGLLGFGQNPKWFNVVMISFSCIQHMWRTISCVVKLSKLFFSQLHLFFISSKRHLHQHLLNVHHFPHH